MNLYLSHVHDQTRQPKWATPEGRSHTLLIRGSLDKGQTWASVEAPVSSIIILQEDFHFFKSIHCPISHGILTMAQHGPMAPLPDSPFVLFSTFPVPRDIPQVADIRERGQTSFTLQAANKCPEKLLIVHLSLHIHPSIHVLTHPSIHPSVHAVYTEHHSWTHWDWGYRDK